MVDTEILVVADSDDVSLLDNLPREGVHLTSPREALRQLRAHPYSVVVLDAGLVDDPAALVERMRSEAEASRIIVVTSSPTWRRARQVLQAGASDYFSKVLDLDRLRERIGQYLGRMVLLI